MVNFFLLKKFRYPKNPRANMVWIMVAQDRSFFFCVRVCGGHANVCSCCLRTRVSIHNQISELGDWRKSQWWEPIRDAHAGGYVTATVLQLFRSCQNWSTRIQAERPMAFLSFRKGNVRRQLKKKRKERGKSKLLSRRSKWRYLVFGIK